MQELNAWKATFVEQDKKLPPGLLSVLSVQQHTEHLGEFGQSKYANGFHPGYTEETCHVNYGRWHFQCINAVTDMWINSFMGNRAILRRRCYTKATLFI
ncbi:hypothetical protein EMCRGX_G034229 [Ephydatia muelleri]